MGRVQPSGDGCVYLLLLLAQPLHDIGLLLEVTQQHGQGRGTGVMPCKQQMEACILRSSTQA